MSSNSRLISTFTLDATNNKILIDWDGTEYTASITPGTYSWSRDGSASDFALALQSTLNGSDVGGGSANFLVRIVGVDTVTGYTAYADGRPLIIDECAFSFITTSSAFTLDPRILGMSSSANSTAAFDAQLNGYYLPSPYVHRYGWYPQNCCMSDLTRRIVTNHVEFSSDSRAAGVPWTNANGHLTISLEFDFIQGALVRIDAANDSNRNANLQLTVGDPNCALERFGIDLALDTTKSFRYYQTITNVLTSSGPYIFPPQSPLWTDPLALSSVAINAGEVWRVSLNGTQYIA